MIHRTQMQFEKSPAALGNAGSSSLPLPPVASILTAAPPSPKCELSVAIPVHNEAESIARTLAALEAQTDLKGNRLDPERYEVLLLANNCRDETTAIARRFGREHPRLRLHIIETTLAEPNAHVGAARRLVMDEACRRLSLIHRPRGVIASTDGDTWVAPTWAAATLREIAEGADAVGGRIHSGPDEVAALEPGARLRYRLDNTYRALRAAYESALDCDAFNVWPRHYQYFGASMAVTVETYRAAGGLPAAPVLEDMAFSRILERIDARLRHSLRVRVQTSLRCVGKVDAGLSATLMKWTVEARAGDALRVESAEAIERLALDRRCVRRLWEHRRVESLPANDERPREAAASLQVDAVWLAERLVHASAFGALWQEVSERQREQKAGHWAFAPAEIRQTIEQLRSRLAVCRFQLASGHVRRDGNHAKIRCATARGPVRPAPCADSLCAIG
jgi:hypothetical protein